MAISQNGVEAYHIFEGACNKEILSDFMIDELNPVLSQQNKAVLMDNVRFHHSEIVQASIDPSIDLHYLPAYSPQLNPIEQVFSLIKGVYKKQKVSENEEVIPAVRRAIQAVQARTNLVPFYQNYHKWLGKALRRDEFET